MEENISQDQPVGIPVNPVQCSQPVKGKPWLKIALFLVLGSVLVGGLVFAGIQIGKKQNQPSVQLLPTPSTVTFQSPTPAEVVTPKSDPTANWRIYEVDYRSTKTFGFRLKYPDDPKWNISEVKYGVVIANREMNFPDYSPIEHGLFKLDVIILDSEMDATQWLEEQKKTINSMTGRLDQYLNIKSITVDSRKGIYYERNDGTRDSTSTPGNVVIEAPNNHLVLFESYFDFKNNKEIFDQILSTFKLIDQSQTDETANWKTYTSQGGKYSVKYSSNIKIYENEKFSVDGVKIPLKNTTVLLSDALPDLNTNYQMSINYNLLKENTSRKEFIDNYSSCEEIKFEKGKVFSIGEKEALIFEDTPCGAYGMTAIYSVSNGLGYIIQIETNARYKDIKKYTDPIFSTFKFLE